MLAENGTESFVGIAKEPKGNQARGVEVPVVVVSHGTKVACKHCLLHRHEDGKHYYKIHETGSFKGHMAPYHGPRKQPIGTKNSSTYAANGCPAPRAAAGDPNNFVDLTSLNPATVAAIKKNHSQ